MPFSWKDAADLVLQITRAIFAAVEAGKTREEAIREAMAVANRREQIDDDVAAATSGRRPGG